MRLIKNSFMVLLSIIKSNLAIFSRRDAVIIAFFTLLGIGGVFAAGLVTITAPEAQGAGYIAATTCDSSVTINKNVVFDTVSKRYVVTTISLSNVDQRYDPNGVNGCGNRVLEMAIPINGVINYTSWSIPSSSVSNTIFNISSGLGCSRYDSVSPTISIDSTLLNNIALTVQPGTTSIEDDSALQIKYLADEYDSYSGSGNTIYDLIGTAQNGAITNNSGLATDNRGVKYLSISESNLSSILTNPTPQGTTQSIFLWIYPLDSNSDGISDGGVIYNEIGSGGGWHDPQIEMVNGKVRFNRWSTNGSGGYFAISPNPFESTAITPNQWHLIGFSGTLTQITGYIDGSSIGTATQPWLRNGSDITHKIGGSDSVTNMGDGTNGDFRFNSFYLFSKALSSTEVTALYNFTKNCKR
jgi:Concanavalin A-like lectin/glucanases superfamily